MLRKTMIIGGACILTAALWLTFNQKNVKNEPIVTEVTTDNLTKSPGWFNDYVSLKGLDKVNLPKDLRSRWKEQDVLNSRFKQKGLNSLENIKEVGPDHVGGRTRSVVIDYSDESHILIGGVSGGLFYSNDNGTTWNITDDNAVSLAVTSITQSPFDPAIFYYSTGEQWTGKHGTQFGEYGKVFGQGIFVTKDGGETTTHLESSIAEGLDKVWDIEHSYTFDSTLYIGTENNGIWVTRDGGESYTKIYNTSRRVHEVHAFHDSTIMFSLEGSGIYKLDEITLQVTKKSNGLPTTNFTRISFDYCVDDPDIMYAQYLFFDNDPAVRDYALRGMYKSTDGAESWVPVSSPAGVNYTQGWYDFKISVSPTDPDFVVTGAVTAGYTRDGGQSWFILPNSHVDHHEFTFYSNGQEFINGNDGGVYRYSVNNVNSITDLNRGYNVTQFYAGYYHPTKDDVVAGAQDNNTRYSQNGSGAFVNILGGDGAFCAIHQQDPSIMYLSSQNLNLRRREGNQYINIRNYIYSQRTSTADLWFINPFEMNPLDGDQLFVPTRGIGIFRSLTKGNTWSRIGVKSESLVKQFGSMYAVGLSWDEDPTAYFGGTASHLIFRLDNAATSDSAILISTPLNVPREFWQSTIGCIEVDPNDAGTIYCALIDYRTTGEGRIWKITDADTDNPEWQNLHSNLPENLPVNWVEVDPDNPNFLIIGTDFGLYTSTNGGGWWEKETRIPNVPVDQIRLRHSDRKLYIFTYGRGAWTANLAENPTASVQEAKQQEDIASFYPNPATNFIQLNLKEQGRYRIYDNSGKEVLNGAKSRIDVSSLLNGVYYVEVTAKGITSVEKLIISRN